MDNFFSLIPQCNVQLVVTSNCCYVHTYYYILILSCTATYLALRSMHGCNAIHTEDPMSIHEVELQSTLEYLNVPQYT